MTDKYNYGKCHVFTSKTDDADICIRAGKGENLVLENVTFSGTTSINIGSDSQVIYNNGTSMTGSDNFTYDGTDIFVSGGVKTGNIYGSATTDSLGYNEIYRGTAPTSVVTTQTTNLDNLGSDVVMARSNNRVAWACPKTNDGGASMWLETAPSVFSEYTSALLTYSALTTGAGTKFIGLNEDADILVVLNGDEADGIANTWTRSGTTWTLAPSTLVGISACRVSGNRLFSYMYTSNFRTHLWNGSSWVLEYKVLSPQLSANLNLDYPIWISGSKLGLYYSGNVRVYTIISSVWTLTTTIPIVCISMDYYNGVLAILSSSELKIYENEVLTQTISLANANKVCTNGTYIFASNTSGVIRIYKKVGSTWTQSVNTYTLTGAGKMSANTNYLAVGAPTIGTYGTGYLFKIETYNNSPVIINTIDLVDASSRVKITAATGVEFGNTTEVIMSDTTEATTSSGALLLQGGLSVNKQIFCNSATTFKNTHFSIISGGNPSISTNTNTVLGSAYWGTSPVITNESGIGALTYSNGIVTINKAGTYDISYFVCLAPNATGTRSSSILLNNNSAVPYGYVSVPASSFDRAGLCGSSVLILAVNDTLRINVYQNSGGNLSMDSVIPGRWQIYRLA